MRLSFLLLALVAAATAVPQLQTTAGNVDVLKKQLDILKLLQQVFQEIPDLELRKICKEYDIKENLHEYRDQGVVKYLIRAVGLNRIQRKGVPFTSSISDLRKEVAVLTRTFLSAKDYTIFVKTAAWARCVFSEAQFVKAFVAAVLQRPDTRDIAVLPATYEVFPYYYFDARVIREAQKIRTRCIEKSETRKIVEIPVKYTAWLAKGEESLAYFTQDIGLAAYYAYFNLAGWMLPKIGQTSDDVGVHNYECDRCEIGRGAQYYYVHQQILARYGLERLSNNLWPITDVDWTRLRTPFKSHLSYPNGLEFPGRVLDINVLPQKEHLVRTVWRLEKRLKDAIDSGFTISTQGSLLALYNHKGLDVLGNLIEGTGRSINPRFYGSLQGVARELLGGVDYKYFWNPTPSALEISHTATRDPMFYKLYKHIIFLFKRYQDALPMYKEDDLMLPGVKIESVKFDRLVTFCDKFKVDIDAATTIPCDKPVDENVQIKAVVERLNHKKFTYEIVVDSDKTVKGAVCRVYMGPKFDYDGSYVDIYMNRHRFVELDQFICNIKEGKTVIIRNSGEAPMRSHDILTKKDIFRKVEDALNSHLPFYADKTAQIYGFPERLALPKGKREGLPLQIMVIVSSPTKKTMTYGPVVSKQFQTYQYVDFENLVGDYVKDINVGKYFMKYDDTFTTDRKVDYTDDVRRTENIRTRRSIDGLYGMRRDRDYDRDITKTGERVDTTLYERNTDDTIMGKYDYLMDYYKDKHITEIMGGFISLDGRPLGFPLDRPLALGCLWVPNIKVIDVKVFWEGEKCWV